MTLGDGGQSQVAGTHGVCEDSPCVDSESKQPVSQEAGNVGKNKGLWLKE